LAGVSADLLYSCFGTSYPGAFTAVALAAVGKSLDGIFDAVLSIEAVGIYKPHPRVCQLALDRFALPAAAICFQSSNGWDAYSAATLGMRVVWCNSYGPDAGAARRQARSRDHEPRGAAGSARPLSSALNRRN
jgi:FMN phosphatase YigB (HAD superfamily)